MINISTKWSADLFAELLVTKSDGSVIKSNIFKNDVITLNYIEDHELKSVTGRVANISFNFKNTPVIGSTLNPKDTIKNDIEVNGITLDTSTLYNSSFITINTKEVVEPSGTSNVVKVEVVPNIKASITVDSYNGSEMSTTTLSDIVVSTQIPTISYKLPDNKVHTISGIVSKFLYKEDAEKIKITDMVIKDMEAKIHEVAFKDVISLSEEPPAEEEQSGEITPPDGPSGEDDF